MSKVRILDYTALVNLRAELKLFSESLIDPLESVEQELDDILQKMKEKLDVLWEDKQRAEEHLSKAESALSHCEASQEWDEEDHCYHPSCNWERRSVESARAQYSKACKRYEEANRIYKEVDYEASEYLKPRGFIQIGGAAAYLKYKLKNLDDADDKMERILELTEKYLGAKVSPNGIDKSPSEVRTQLIEEADKKKDKYIIASREVSARIDDIEEDVYEVGITNDDNRKEEIKKFNSNKCPYCGRPLKICICGHGERELERY